MKLGNLIKPSAPAIEDGSYAAIPYSLIYLGTQMFQGEPQKSERFNITFEIPSLKSEFNGEVKPRVISADYGISFGEKSKLPKVIQSIMNRSMTEAEMKEFDLDNLLGNACMIEVGTNDKGYQNIVNVIKLPKGMPVEKQFNLNKILGYSKETWNEEIYNKLPDFMKNKIKTAPQYAICLGLEVETSGFSPINADDVPFA